MKFYLSGPITKLGIEEAKLRFDTYKSELAVRNPAHEFVNPINMVPLGKSWLWYMCRDLLVLSKCDGIIMLPDWRLSRGAKIERMFAKLCRKRVLELQPPLYSQNITN